MKLRITVQGTPYDVDVEVLDDGGPADSTSSVPPAVVSGGGVASVGAAVTSPIAGTVFDVRVKAGDTVKMNDTLLVLEAMKMESNIASTHSGTIREVCVKVGDSVTHGQELVRFE